MVKSPHNLFLNGNSLSHLSESEDLSIGIALLFEAGGFTRLYELVNSAFRLSPAIFLMIFFIINSTFHSLGDVVAIYPALWV
jgi:hypothetical protein